MALPRLREELDLLSGPMLPDGQPSWTLHDPVRNQFIRIDWPTFEILNRWSLDDPAQIVESVCTATTLKIEVEEVDRVARFLIENQLVQVNGDPQGAAKMADRLKKIEGSPIKWLLHHYLFFRVPLVRPDAWLTRFLPLVAFFYTRNFALITLGALVFGLSQVFRRWDSFLASLVDTFNWEGLAAYGVALFFVKLFHELGHAFTAKRFGCRIPAMGVAFLVMWPIAYTDTNESWRLTSRWERLKIASAGILTELVIAAWATLAWGLLPDGELRSVAFVLATTSWVTTLAINASPFMRFDGYFIFSDWLDLPNLHGRSFALARWKLREWLFALGEEKPEYFSPRKETLLVAFAWIVWIYRLIVFSGIAVLVYHFFIKIVGIFLFLVEIVWFIALPIVNEFKAWKLRWPVIKHSARAKRSAYLCLAVLVVFLLPLPSRVGASAILRPTEIWPVFSPGPAEIESFQWQEGSQVELGQELIALKAPELQMKRDSAFARFERLRWQAASAGFDADMRGRWQSTQQEYATVQAELSGLDEEISRYRPKAPFSGQLRDVEPDLQPGQWLGKKEQVALLVGPKGSLVETWLDEDSVKRVSIGDRAIFISEGREGPTIDLTVTNLDVDATRVLNNGLLAAQFGGHILTREKNRQLIPEKAVYRVAFSVDSNIGDLSGQLWRGKVVVRASWEVPAWRYLRNGLSVLLREAGF